MGPLTWIQYGFSHANHVVSRSRAVRAQTNDIPEISSSWLRNDKLERRKGVPKSRNVGTIGGRAYRIVKRTQTSEVGVKMVMVVIRWIIGRMEVGDDLAPVNATR